jgi:hypothetical protein
VVILVPEELRDCLPADRTGLGIIEVLSNALDTEPVPAWKKAGLNHEVHANCAILLHLFLIFVVMAL